MYDLGGLLTFGGLLILVLMSLVSLLMYISIKYGNGEEWNPFQGNGGESAYDRAVRERAGSGSS